MRDCTDRTKSGPLLYTVLLRGNENARYREVHGIERYVLHVNTAKHGIWGKNTVHGISRNTV